MANKSKKPHVYQARWHVDTLKMVPVLNDHPALISVPESTTRKKERGSTKRNKIIIAPLFTEGVTVEQFSGRTAGNWNELAGIYAMHPYRIATTVTHTRKAAAGEQRFLTLFIPLAHNEASPLKSVAQKGVDEAAVQFTDGSKLEISVVNGKLAAKLIK